MTVESHREPWLNKQELAARLHCSIRTIERLCVPAMRVGGQNRYKLSEVEMFLTHRSRPARVIRFPSKERDPAA
ncbi:MAG: helix-turn-helix domain-containing protein [Actinomycetota bacterium]|nr:helix-turn-helix domain-containing protein [Actinomycetota bacterium]